LILKLIIDRNFSVEEEEKLIRKIRETCDEDMNIEIKIADGIALTKYGKSRVVVSRGWPFVK